MRFSYSAVWADVIALLRAHASLIATVAGVFIFLPGLLVAYFLPQPVTEDFTRLREIWVEYAELNWPFLLANIFVNMVGAIAILRLIFARGVTVGGAISGALALLIPYFLASLLSGFLVSFGFVLLIVPGLYLLGRLGPLSPVVVAENRRNPVDALARCFALTRGHGWAVFGLILIVAFAAAIAIGVVTTLAGIAFILVAGQELGRMLELIVSSAGHAALVTLLLLLNAAIYRQLAAAAPAAAAT
ncbi:MAG: hypothetical protein QOJ27_2876 [Sphingomonadales bacterium]|nr:hypothetical protein [Sphingomonadales bacterium]